MTISEQSRDVDPVRRFEVFTGVGRRREWPPEEKAPIVAESYAVGETVSAVAPRYALPPQQLFAWGRTARCAETTSSGSLFVSAVVAPPAPEPVAKRRPPRQKAPREASVIEPFDGQPAALPV